MHDKIRRKRGGVQGERGARGGVDELLEKLNYIMYIYNHCQLNMSYLFFSFPFYI